MSNAILIAPIILIVGFGLLLILNGLLMIFSPSTWAKIPQLWRMSLKIPVGMAWSKSRSTRITLGLVGLMYIGLGATVQYFVLTVLSKH